MEMTINIKGIKLELKNKYPVIDIKKRIQISFILPDTYLGPSNICDEGFSIVNDQHCVKEIHMIYMIQTDRTYFVI